MGTSALQSRREDPAPWGNQGEITTGRQTQSLTQATFPTQSPPDSPVSTCQQTGLRANTPALLEGGKSSAHKSHLTSTFKKLSLCEVALEISSLKLIFE